MEEEHLGAVSRHVLDRATIAKAFLRLRRGCGLTQEAVAKRAEEFGDAGFGRLLASQISDYENGGSLPSMGSFLNLLAACGDGLVDLRDFQSALVGEPAVRESHDESLAAELRRNQAAVAELQAEVAELRTRVERKENILVSVLSLASALRVPARGEVFNRELVVWRFDRGDWVPSLDDEEAAISVCRRGEGYAVSRAGKEVALFEDYSFACVVAAALVSLDLDSDLRFAHPALKLRRRDGGHTRLGEFSRLSPREKLAIRVARWIAGSPRALAWVLSAASPQCLDTAETLICNATQETAEGIPEMR